MLLSLNLEFKGNCKDAIDFYSSVFGCTFKQVQLYREMQLADAFGITKQGLDMVCHAVFETNIGEYCMRCK